MLAAAKDRVEISTMKKLWVEEQKQYLLVKENIDAINIKCHDLKHQIRNLRTTGQVDPAYLDDLERSVSIYNSAVRTGNETLDIVLTDKRLHCASHNIQFTCIADGSGVAFMETMDIFSLFGNILDNAIECDSLQPPEMRFIHLSVRTVNRMLTIHAENHFEDSLQFKDGLPVTTKADKDSHGYGIMSVRHIVENITAVFPSPRRISCFRSILSCRYHVMIPDAVQDKVAVEVIHFLLSPPEDTLFGGDIII